VTLDLFANYDPNAPEVPEPPKKPKVEGPDYEDDDFCLYNADCRFVMDHLPERSIHACVTDPPYELGFMGKQWDKSGVSFRVSTWLKLRRVLVPGAYVLAFGGSRTIHRIATAIEDAGFEIRDMLTWNYGTGFPKGKKIAYAVDQHLTGKATKSGADPQTPEGEQWLGWNTSLKPAFEPIILARKPLEHSLANTVLTYGTGGLNIDDTRIGNDVVGWSGSTKPSDPSRLLNSLKKPGDPRPVVGRWPANTIFDEEAGEILDVATGREISRFFYCPKPNEHEREFGLDHLPTKQQFRYGEGIGAGNEEHNHHATIKPIALMRYLIRLITPPGGSVIDPFTGSGTTGVGAYLEGMKFYGSELDPDYFVISRERMLAWRKRGQGPDGMGGEEEVIGE
jgi:DNA modification methylase